MTSQIKRGTQEGRTTRTIYLTDHEWDMINRVAVYRKSTRQVVIQGFIQAGIQKEIDAQRAPETGANKALDPLMREV